MKKNMGPIDRIIRTIVAVILGGIFILGKVSGIFAAIIAVFAIILIMTSAIGWCPLYSPFNISTKKIK
jgi:hypothetical protein